MTTKSSTGYRKIQSIDGGNSLGVILPKKYALQLGMDAGKSVKVRKDKNSLIIERAEE